MLRLFVALLYVLFPLLATAQANAPAWQQVFGSSRRKLRMNGEVRAVATDAAGNVFVTGFFADAVDFGSTHLTSRGSTDFFVAK